MEPTQRPQRRPLLVFFLAGCGIGLLSSLLLHVWSGDTVGAMLLEPGRLLAGMLGTGAGALLLLAVLRPLRSAGAGLFWACGTGAVVLLWPPLARLVSAALEQAAGGLAPPQQGWTLEAWWRGLLHAPDNLVLVTGSAVLLALAAWLWPAGRSARQDDVVPRARLAPRTRRPAEITPFASLPSRITADAAAQFRARLRNLRGVAPHPTRAPPWSRQRPLDPVNGFQGQSPWWRSRRQSLLAGSGAAPRLGSDHSVA